MSVPPDTHEYQRRIRQEEVDRYLATKILMEQAKAAYDTAKEVYDKGKKHDEERHESITSPH